MGHSIPLGPAAPRDPQPPVFCGGHWNAGEQAQGTATSHPSSHPGCQPSSAKASPPRGAGAFPLAPCQFQPDGGREPNKRPAYLRPRGGGERGAHGQGKGLQAAKFSNTKGQCLDCPVTHPGHSGYKAWTGSGGLNGQPLCPAATGTLFLGPSARGEAAAVAVPNFHVPRLQQAALGHWGLRTEGGQPQVRCPKGNGGVASLGQDSQGTRRC